MHPWRPRSPWQRHRRSAATPSPHDGSTGGVRRTRITGICDRITGGTGHAMRSFAALLVTRAGHASGHADHTAGNTAIAVIALCDPYNTSAKAARHASMFDRIKRGMEPTRGNHATPTHQRRPPGNNGEIPASR